MPYEKITEQQNPVSSGIDQKSTLGPIMIQNRPIIYESYRPYFLLHMMFRLPSNRIVLFSLTAFVSSSVTFFTYGRIISAYPKYSSKISS